MPLSDEQKHELQSYMDDKYMTFEVELFQSFLSREELDKAHDQARRNIAQEAGVTYEQMLDFLGESPDSLFQRSHSVWGGKTGAEWLRLCRDKTYQKLLESKETIVKVCCSDLEYCKRKKAETFSGEGHTIVIVICDGLASAAIGFPAPITMVTSYLIRNKILDSWCGCNRTIS